jgi:hypothetical protein
LACISDSTGTFSVHVFDGVTGEEIPAYSSTKDFLYADALRLMREISQFLEALYHEQPAQASDIFDGLIPSLAALFAALGKDLGVPENAAEVHVDIVDLTGQFLFFKCKQTGKNENQCEKIEQNTLIDRLQTFRAWCSDHENCLDTGQKNDKDSYYLNQDELLRKFDETFQRRKPE